MSTHSKVIDVFTGYDEIELAELRISYLSSFVKKTIIFESELTHSGKAKPLFFTKWLEQNSHLKDRVEVKCIDIGNFDGPWEREIGSREIAAQFIYENYPDCYFILSDLDEIPSLEQVESHLMGYGNFHFLTPTCYRFVNWMLPDNHKKWRNGLLGHTSIDCGPNGGRFVPWPVITSVEPGIHLSYVGRDVAALQFKYFGLVETQESYFTKSFQTREVLEYVNHHAIDHLGRSRSQGFGLLEIRQELNFSEVQKFIFSKAPHLFRFELGTGQWIKRFIASIKISTMRNRAEVQELAFNDICNIDMDLGKKLELWIHYNLEIFISMWFAVKRSTKSCLKKMGVS